MTPNDQQCALGAMELLRRVDLKGGEVDAYNHIVRWLSGFTQPQLPPGPSDEFNPEPVPRDGTQARKGPQMTGPGPRNHDDPHDPLSGYRPDMDQYPDTDPAPLLTVWAVLPGVICAIIFLTGLAIWLF